MQELLTRASERRQASDYEAAAALYQRALECAPRLATAWYNLGLCQRMTGRFEDALTSYRQAIDNGVDRPEEAHLNRGVIFSDALRRDDDAEHELRQALAINPAYTPALLNLANLMDERGRREEAEALYERVLSVEPMNATALARLATLSRSDESAGRMAARLQTALKRDGIGLSDRAALSFGLGEVLDRSADYAGAFAAYQEANAASRAFYRANYDRAAAEALIDRIMATPPALTGVSARAWSPVFICGMYRSGSTLLEQVLAGCPRITPCGELNLIPELARRTGGFPEPVAPSSGAELADAYESAVRRMFPGVDIATDKQPGNLLYVGLIKQMFPNAKIVHTVRHPLDNILSVYFLHLDPSMAYALDLLDAAHWYRQCQKLADHWRTTYPDAFVDFNYDAFVSAPSETAKALFEFLQLPWSDEYLAIDQRANAVKTASVWQVRESLHRKSSGRWRNYKKELAEARAYLQAEGLLL